MKKLSNLTSGSTIWIFTIFGSIALFVLLLHFFFTRPDVPSAVVNITPEVYLLEDPKTTMSLLQVLGHDQQGKFRKAQTDLIRFNNSTSTVWIKFKVDAARDRYCQLSSPNIHYVTFYRPRATGDYEEIVTGFLHPFSTREVDMDRLTFSLSPSQEWHYIKIKSDHFLNTALHIGDLQGLNHESFKRLLLYSAYTGVMLIIAAYALLLAIQNLRPHFMLYFLYVLAMTIDNLAEKGFLFQFLWPHEYSVNFYFPVLTYCVTLCILLFIQKLFDVEKIVPVFYRISLFVITLFPAAVSIFLLVAYRNYHVFIIMAQLHSLLAVMSVVYISLRIAFSGKGAKMRSPVYILVTGLLVFGICIVVYILAENTVLPITIFTENSILVGSALEAIFFTATILNYEKLVRNRLISVVNEQNKKLQIKVNERTEELLHKNARLEDLIREKDGLISIVAHDLKAPLNQAKALSQLAQMEKNIPEGVLGLINRIEKVSNHGLQLIKELFEVTIVESTTEAIAFSKVNLAQLSREAVDNFSPVARDKAIQLNFFSDKEIEIDTYPPYVIRILENILSNAIKYSPHGSVVETKLHETNSSIIISIRDKGQGFTDEDKKKMFRKFQRLSAMPTAGESSHGLGLYIMKTLADRIRAVLSVESEVQRGTVFSLQFFKNEYKFE